MTKANLVEDPYNKNAIHRFHPVERAKYCDVICFCPCKENENEMFRRNLQSPV